MINPASLIQVLLYNTLFLQKIKIYSLNYSVTITFLYILKLDNFKLSNEIIIIIIIGDQLLVNNEKTYLWANWVKIAQFNYTLP